MQFPNQPFSNEGHPLIKSPFSQHWEGEGINPPPPGTFVRITDAGEDRITDSDDIRITDQEI